MARSSFQKLAAQISKHLKLPLTGAIIVEFLSNIQIIYLLLKSTFDFNISTTFSFAAYAREISAYSGAVNVFDPPVSNTTFQAICYGLFGYIVLHIMLFIGFLILQMKPKIQISEPLSKGISLLYLLHTRLFIFPIHYFFCGIFQLYKNCHQHEGSSDFYCQQTSIILAIVACIFNILICAIVELFFYDINKSKNAYAVKTNTLNQAVLLHKTLAILIYFLSTDTGDNGALGAIFNILITILSVYLLFAKLPFYETILLRIKVVFLGIILGSSIIFIINVCSVKETKLEIPWLILCILLTKCLLIIFDLLLQSIMNSTSGGKNFTMMTPEKAMHYFILLKDYNFGHVHMEVHRKKFPKDSLLTNGSLIRNHIDPSYIKHKKRGKDFENEVYKLALEKLLQVLNKYPKSIPLNLFVAQIYLKKLGNISQVVSLLKRIQGENLSMVHRNALDEFNIFLKKTYTKQYLKTDNKLKLIDYFHYRQIASDLKDTVQLEINTHLDFWNEVKQETVNVWRTFQLGYQVETLANKVETTFHQNLLGFYKTSCNILLTHRIYLERVRELPNEARKMMTKFIAISNNPLLRHALDVYSEDQAVVVISLQKDQMGNILDVSGSTQSLFEIDKNKLIGRGINTILPGVFAQIQLNFLQGFAKEVTHQLQHRVKIYGKTSDGSLLELEAQMQLYPVLDKEIKVMILFEKISMPLPILVVGRDGGILECSESLKRGFEGRTIVPGTTLVQDIFQEFDEINRAFNVVYSNNTKEYHDSNVVKKQKLKRKNPKITILNEQDTPEDIEKEPAKSTVYHQQTQSERSKKLCDEYKQGSKLVFSSLEEDRIETVFDVQIEPYILDGYFFKIVTFKNQSHHYKTSHPHPQHSLLFDPFAEFSKGPISSGGEDDFAEDFSYADERKGQHGLSIPEGSRRQSHFLALRTTSFLKQQASSDIMTIPMERNFQTRMTTDIFAKVTRSIGSTIPKTDEKSKQQPTSLELVKTQKIHHIANSVTSYATTGIHAIKTLKRVFSSGSTFPLARYAGIVSGFLITIMIVLSVVFYIFSKAAINKHEADTSIINGVNSRLDEAIDTWELITRMHLDSVGLGKDNVDDVDNQINEEAVLMLQTNNQLDIKLSNILDDKRLSDVYSSTINLWEPCTETTTNDDPINTFQATTILYQRFSNIESLPLSCITNASNDIIYTLNNTGNDYLVASENLVTIARNVVEQALDTNIQNLEFIIIGESVTLVALCAFLFAMVYIIISRYRRLFRALLKIDENHITLRVKQLQKVLKALDGDIEGRNFGIEADGSDEDIILIQKEQSKKGIKTKSFSRRGDNFVVRNFLLYMLKYIILTCVFVIIPAIIFYASLLESIHHFTSLDIIDDQLSVTSKIQYQINLLTSNLYLDMMFRNETDIFIRNQETEVQLPINLELMTTYHDQMIFMFFDDGDDVSDPIVRELLTNTVCNFLVDPSTTLADYCQDATDGGTIGLIALELRYNSLSSDYIATYLANPTYDTANEIVEPYAADVRPVLETLEAAYSFLNDHLLANSESKVSDFESKQIIFFIFTLLTTIVAGFVTYYYAIRKLRYLDMGRGKILKLLPYNMITENRALDYYLKREFSNKNLQFGRRN